MTLEQLKVKAYDLAIQMAKLQKEMQETEIQIVNYPKDENVSV